MAGTEPEETFKVTDRRRRDDADEPRGHDTPTIEPPREARTDPRAEPSRGAAQEAPPRSAPGRNLIGLFMMLAQSAMMALGEASEPGMGAPRANPQEAAALVDLLLLLREKTEGHRTAEESEVLGELIYDLQLRYINLTKPRAKPRGSARAARPPLTFRPRPRDGRKQPGLRDLGTRTLPAGFPPDPGASAGHLQVFEKSIHRCLTGSSRALLLCQKFDTLTLS